MRSNAPNGRSHSFSRDPGFLGGGSPSSMDKRRGIAATAASAVFFSAILIANFALVSSSQDRLTLYKQAGVEDSLFDQSIATAASAEAQLLFRVQSAIGSMVMACGSAEDTVAGLISGTAVVQTAGNVTVKVSSDGSDAGSSYDDLSLSPFDGYAAGDINVPLSVNASGSFHWVQLSTDYVVPAHLPAHISSVASDCLGAVNMIEAALSKSTLHGCNSTAIGSLMSRAEGQSFSASARDGFAFGLSYYLANSDPCVVRFTVTIEQNDINGPGGPFSIRLREDGWASLRVPTPPASPRSTTRTVPL